MSVVGQFDLISQKYDNQRRFLIPCFDAFYESAARALKENLPPSRRNIKILDLGAGTGLMTQYAYSAFADRNPSVAILDRCATVEENINWLHEAGFSKAECVFGHLDFAVICTVK